MRYITSRSKSTVVNINIKVSGGEHHAVNCLKLVEFRGSSLCGGIWLLNFMSVMSVPASVEAVCHHGAVSNAGQFDLWTKCQEAVVKILGRGCPVDSQLPYIDLVDRGIGNIINLQSQLPYIDLVDRGIGNIINFKRGPVGNLVWLMSKVTKMTRGSAIREE